MYVGTHSAVLGGSFPETNSELSPKLVKAAHEFEGQMMKELLKPMNSEDQLFGDDSSESGSGGALGEFAGESLAQALSNRGGFGIADQIIRELTARQKVKKNS